MKIFAFGDIHGEFNKLKALINRLSIDDSSLLVFLGDYIDRGEKSFEVIEFLIQLSNKYKCIFIRGNHESMFVDYISGINQDMFVLNGGGKTITSYEVNGYDINPLTPYNKMRIPEGHLEFLINTKLYYEDKNYIFVHAGIIPSVPMNKQPEEILLWDRDFHYGVGYKGKTVVFGHTPNRIILNDENKICIDTGACFDGMGDLTCVQLPGRIFIRQSWTLEDNLYGNDYGKAVEESSKNISKDRKDISDRRKGGWSI